MDLFFVFFISCLVGSLFFIFFVHPSLELLCFFGSLSFFYSISAHFFGLHIFFGLYFFTSFMQMINQNNGA